MVDFSKIGTFDLSAKQTLAFKDYGQTFLKGYSDLTKTWNMRNEQSPIGCQPSLSSKVVPITPEALMVPKNIGHATALINALMAFPRHQLERHKGGRPTYKVVKAAQGSAMESKHS